MFVYICKRILMMIPILLGIIIIVFSLMYLIPGDPTRSILGENASDEALQQLRTELKLDDPYFVRLGDYIWGLLHGDLGTSYKTKLPIFDEIMSRYPTTLIITFGSVGLGLILGILFGIISAVRQYSILDRVCTTISLFGVSAPSFWVAMILVLIFSVKLKWFPATGTTGFTSWILPIFTLGLNSSALIMRMTRSSMLEVVRQDYIRTAKAKGQRELKIITHHALRNSLIPVVTVIGIQICALMAGAVLVESVFALPGIGKYVVDSIGFRDFPAVQGVILWIGLNCVVINLIVDIVYCFIDPRIKSMYKGSNPFKSMRIKLKGAKANG